MRTSIILILTIGLTATLTSCQSQWPSPGFPQSSYQPSQYQPPQQSWSPPPAPSQYQPSQYRPSIPPAPAAYRGASSGQWQSSPQLATLSQLPSYNRASLPSPSWGPSPANNPRGWSIPAPTSSYANIPQPPSAGYSSYSRPALTSSAPQPAQVQGPPFQSSWSIQHQSAAPAQQPAPRPLSLPAAQPQSYNIPSPPQQSWSPPSPPVQTWRAPAPAPATQWSAPAPAPASQWSPPATPAQTYSPPQPAPAPQPSYSSPQNSQNLRPAPVHYASIGEQLQGDYKFGYHTGDGGSFREETRLPDGTVQGAYGFIDADGKQRIVKYRAGKDGFQAEGDDVPKGSPVASGGDGATAPAPQPAAPIRFEEGAAFRSFSQG